MASARRRLLTKMMQSMRGNRFQGMLPYEVAAPQTSEDTMMTMDSLEFSSQCFESFEAFQFSRSFYYHITFFCIVTLTFFVSVVLGLVNTARDVLTLEELHRFSIQATIKMLLAFTLIVVRCYLLRYEPDRERAQRFFLNTVVCYLLGEEIIDSVALLLAFNPNRLLSFIFKQVISMPITAYVCTTLGMSFSLFMLVVIAPNLPRNWIMVSASHRLALVNAQPEILHQMAAVFLLSSMAFTVPLFYAVDKQNRYTFALLRTQVAVAVEWPCRATVLCRC